MTYMLKERWHLRCQSLRRWIQKHNISLPGVDDKLPCGFGIGMWLYRRVCESEGQNIDVPDQNCSHAPKNMKIWEHAYQYVY